MKESTAIMAELGRADFGDWSGHFASERLATRHAKFLTEDYMVDFLLDNTLGAWWAGKRLINRRERKERRVQIGRRSAVVLHAAGMPMEIFAFHRRLEPKS